MKNLNYTLLLMPIVLLFAFSCKHKAPEKKFLPGLPVAENSNKILSSDSCFFSVSVKEDSIMVADNDTSCFIKDFIEIGDFVCKRMKAGKINTNSDYPIILYLDSLTPYPVVDSLVEELQMLEFNLFYFKTRENGFKLGFPELYTCYRLGQNKWEKMIRMKKMINECNPLYQSNSSFSRADYPPPPPPPPPPPAEISSFYLKKIYSNPDKLDKSEIAFVSYNGSEYVLNNKTLNKIGFAQEINNRRILFIKMNRENTYNDLIKLIDIIYTVINLRLDYYSIQTFGKSFKDLDETKKSHIKHKYFFGFELLTLEKLKYIESPDKLDFEITVTSENE